jgi:hypothetical protein
MYKGAAYPAQFTIASVNMIKPYLYGGIVLLIVGLFSFNLYQSSQLENYQLQLEQVTTQLETAIKDLANVKEDNLRKTGALDVYMAKDIDIKAALDKAVWLIKGYTKRDTPNEKCLDMSPPPELLRLHSPDNLSGQGDLHSSEPIPSKATSSSK